MENWKLTSLGDVANFVRGPFGGSLKKEYFVDEGYAVYEQQHAIRNQFHSIRYYIDENKFKEMKRFELHENDIIMSCSGTMGRVAIVPNNIKRGIINQALLKISPSNKLDSKFLENYMKSETFLNYLNAEVKGVAIKNVASVKDLKQIPILLPPISKQQAIVEKLDFAFDAIEKAKANIEKNIENAKELFQSKLNAIFSQKGEGWEEKKLKEIGRVQTGTTPKTAESDNYGDFIPFIKPADFKKDGSIVSKGSYLSEKGLKSGRLINENSALMVCIGATIGKTGYSLVPVSCNQQINAITPTKEFNYKFIYYGLISNVFNNKVLKEGKGAQATLPIINKSKWENLTMNVTLDLIKQKQIVSQLDLLSEQTNLLQEKYKHKLANLEELKKSILEKAFKGELI